MEVQILHNLHRLHSISRHELEQILINFGSATQVTLPMPDLWKGIGMSNWGAHVMPVLSAIFNPKYYIRSYKNQYMIT